MNISEFKYDFSEELRRMRQLNGFTLEDISRRSGIHLSALRAMEMGREMQWGVLLKLARFYGKKVKLVFY